MKIQAKALQLMHIAVARSGAEELMEVLDALFGSDEVDAELLELEDILEPSAKKQCHDTMEMEAEQDDGEAKMPAPDPLPTMLTFSSLSIPVDIGVEASLIPKK